ncbi:MAG: hypothetical protein OXC02_05405 [Rhodobacteraceae bacterium]|nr:hypothetical protein [Paracoccaceae bacterium]
MQPSELIDTAHHLVDRNSTGKPRQSDLNRAMSTAYYAMFHALCRNCADCVVGTRHSLRSELAWMQAYRAANHSTVNSRCLNKLVMNQFPKNIQEFADSFVALQKKRHQADYNPENEFTIYEVMTEIDAAQKGIEKLNNSSIEDRTAFVVYTVMQKR